MISSSLRPFDGAGVTPPPPSELFVLPGVDGTLLGVPLPAAIAADDFAGVTGAETDPDAVIPDFGNGPPVPKR